MAIAAKRGYVVRTMDVVPALLPGKVEEEVYVRQATGSTIKDDTTGVPVVMKLKKSLYGLRQSPRNFGNTFAKGIKVIGVAALRSDPCMDDGTLAGKTPSVVEDSEESTLKQVSHDGRWTSYTTFGNGDLPRQR